MAMTLRLTENQEATLDAISESIESSTRSKTIQWIIEQWMVREEQKKAYYDDLQQTTRELLQLKKNVAAYLRTQNELKEMEKLLTMMS